MDFKLPFSETTLLVVGLLSGVVCLGVFVGVVFWILTWTGLINNGKQPRGFEVKQITGEKPVLREERDNDHG